MLKFDLHCHSNVSDGTLPPEDVAARAYRNGVDVWALTDHDEVGGVARARATAKQLGMHFVSGVEISVTWAGQTVHIVGLGFDETNADLVAGLASVRGGRLSRGQQMGKELEAVGIPGAFEGALRHAGNPDLLSRTHFARYILEQGYAKSISDVFKRYLAEGNPGFVPHNWAKLEDAVRWITGAGGVAVIAHPGRYRYNALQFGEFFSQFLDLGGKGIEVITGSHAPEQYDEYAAVARRYGFMVSTGSDFHGPGESRADLGSLPSLPADLTPVWHDWELGA